MASSGPVLSFSGTPTITTAKLNWKNYLSWSASVELWFLGQGHHDHLEKAAEEVPIDKRPEWEKLDDQLCAVLWQSAEALRPSGQLFGFVLYIFEGGCI